MSKKETKLVTFLPAVDFAGYPFGKKIEFKAGVESIPVSEEYAQLMRDKGHVVKGTHLHEPASDAD